jgi:hypothetical protein
LFSFLPSFLKLTISVDVVDPNIVGTLTPGQRASIAAAMQNVIGVNLATPNTNDAAAADGTPQKVSADLATSLANVCASQQPGGCNHACITINARFTFDSFVPDLLSKV